MAPGSILAGWNGTTARNVVVRATNGSTDRLTVYDAANSTLLPLGTVNLRRNDYVTGAVTFGAAGSARPSTLSMAGNSLTVMLGTPAPANRLTTAGGAANVTWTPSTGATDLAGNAAMSTAFTETDNDRDY